MAGTTQLHPRKFQPYYRPLFDSFSEKRNDFSHVPLIPFLSPFHDLLATLRPIYWTFRSTIHFELRGNVNDLRRKLNHVTIAIELRIVGKCIGI